MRSLAVKYRPKSFDDLTEQSAVVSILTNQIQTGTIKHGYLFCGGAGTGKTTSARIFADMINNGKGVPIELDAASNNSVDDIRRLTEDAQTQSIDSEYKVFVIDECHMITTQGWNAFLKTLEEPPAKSIFIMCTTNPEKIPNTILSRVQRYNFQKISTEGIIKRLHYIVDSEFGVGAHVSDDAIDYIAKLAEGGMRDAITLLDKCLSYSEELKIDDVISALGVVDYSALNDLTTHILNNNKCGIIKSIDTIYNSGMDLKLFVKTFFEYILDVDVYSVTRDIDYTKIPPMFEDTIKKYDLEKVHRMLSDVTQLQSTIKWEPNPKPVILAKLLLLSEAIV